MFPLACELTCENTHAVLQMQERTSHTSGPLVHHIPRKIKYLGQLLSWGHIVFQIRFLEDALHLQPQKDLLEFPVGLLILHLIDPAAVFVVQL